MGNKTAKQPTKEVESFDKNKLKKVETDEKKPLPTLDGMQCLSMCGGCIAVSYYTWPEPTFSITSSI